MSEQWDELDQKYGRKVGYVMSNGWKSTAYLDQHLGDGLYGGTDKYSDEPVRVKWDDEHEVYYQLLPGED